jgi:hypothetical protein
LASVKGRGKNTTTSAKINTLDLCPKGNKKELSWNREYRGDKEVGRAEGRKEGSRRSMIHMKFQTPQYFIFPAPALPL